MFLKNTFGAWLPTGLRTFSAVSALAIVTTLGLPAARAADPSLPAAAPGEAASNPAIEPLILFENDRLVTCGLRATFPSVNRPVSVDITLHRSGETAEWIVGFNGSSFDKDSSPPSDLGVKTESIDTHTAFSKPQAGANGGFEMRGALDAASGATFIREILIQGATISLIDAKGLQQQFQLKGPLPQTVRSNYLMCAGDLFR